MGSEQQPAQQRAHQGEQGLRVLIVEDEALMAIDIETTLADAGCEIVGVADRCGTAIQIAEAERPDLVVMDIGLAGKRDGVEGAVVIRKRYDIPTMFVSGQFDGLFVGRAREAEPLAWLSKPLDKEQFLTVVQLKRDRLARAR